MKAASSRLTALLQRLDREQKQFQKFRDGELLAMLLEAIKQKHFGTCQTTLCCTVSSKRCSCLSATRTDP